MPVAVLIRPVEPGDAAPWQRMREALWPEESGDHASDIAQSCSASRTSRTEVLLACLGSGIPVGFVELSIRPYAEGCSTDRVAFVEGWFVQSAYRGRGIKAALMAAAEVGTGEPLY